MTAIVLADSCHPEARGICASKYKKSLNRSDLTCHLDAGEIFACALMLL